MTEISKLPANCVPLAFKAIFPEKSDEEILEALYKVKGFIPGKGGFWFRYVKVFDVFGVYYEEHIRYRFQKEIPQLKREVPVQDKFGPNHYYRLSG